MGQRLVQILSAVMAGLLLFGCGGEEGEAEFPATSGDLDAERIDWVVDGMSCDGDEVIRLVGLVDDDGEVYAEYLRGDECVDEGQRFWESRPREEGDEVDVLIDGDQERSTLRAGRAGEYAISLVDDDGVELTMRQAHAELNPSPRPDLDDIDLAGEWLMEGYPCSHEQVPQLVRIIHPPGSLHMNKVLGDECIGDGESFIDDAELGGNSGTSISGEPRLSESSDFNDSDGGDDDIAVELGGTVYNDNYVRLSINADIVELGDSVTLRRVMAE